MFYRRVAFYRTSGEHYTRNCAQLRPSSDALSSFDKIIVRDLQLGLLKEILTDEQASPFLTTHEENDVCQRKEENKKIEKPKDFMPVVSINSKPKCFGEVSPRQTKEAPLNFLSQLHFHEKQLLDQLGAD